MKNNSPFENDSYDAHGNVEWMMQDVPGLRRTYIHYEYDLVSGNVTKVAYNDHPSRIDRFYHRYEYDADNRITRVETSRDGIIWDTDARYDYYAHGPLERTEIGHDKLQGTDYVYNLHGWLKAKNHPSLNVSKDPGNDDGNTFAKDIFGMQLNYYNGDFDRTGSPFSQTDGHYLTPENELFNGGISSWASHIGYQEGSLEYEQLTGQTFVYDELNRLMQANFDNYASGWNNNTDNEFNTAYTYDANGKILTLTRNAHGSGNNTFDDLTASYFSNTNRLESVQDNSTSSLDGTLNDVSGTHEYKYDQTGNLAKDLGSDIDTILWNSFGLVKEVHKTDSTVLVFTYNGNQQRVIKEVRTSMDTTVTYYMRDASGNLMARYERTKPDSMYEYRIKALPLYGSSRIGVYKPDLLYKTQAPEDCEGCCCCILEACYHKNMDWHKGMFTRHLTKKHYEFYDHLNTLRLLYNDRKLPQDTTGGMPTDFKVDVLNYSNYFPYGSLMGQRYHGPDATIVGFNGMLADDEVREEKNSYDFGARWYNPRGVPFWGGMDKYFKEYAPVSPYVFALNSPIKLVDAEGNIVVDENGNPVTITITEGEDGAYSAIFDFAPNTSEDVQKNFIRHGGRIIETAVQIPTGREQVKNAIMSNDKIHMIVSPEEKIDDDKIILGQTEIKRRILKDESGEPVGVEHFIGVTIFEGSIEFMASDIEGGLMPPDRELEFRKHGLSTEQKVGSVASHELEHATNPVDVKLLKEGQKISDKQHDIAKQKGAKSVKEFGEINRKKKEE